MNYYNLAYMKQEDFPRCEYDKAGAMRSPIRAAINSARLLPGAKMENVKAVLEAALAHIATLEEEIDDTEQPTVPSTSGSTDPLDILLGPAEVELNAGIGRE